jgi:hypothetical protein
LKGFKYKKEFYMKKNVVLFVLLVCASFTLFAKGKPEPAPYVPPPVLEQPQGMVQPPASDFDLELGESGITIKKYKGKAEEVSIPAEIDRITVTTIGDSAFSGCSKLRSIIIPNSVTAIGNSAFSGCGSLTSITIPSSVTSIGKSAFNSCGSLTTIAIPNGVTSIGNSAFNSCSSLRSITIPNSVTSIGNSAFSGCSSLTSIAIPSSITAIGNSAFGGCTSLTSITVDDANTAYRSVYGVLFTRDSKTIVCYPAGMTYTSYIIPNSVTSIVAGAFMGNRLTSMTIGPNVKVDRESGMPGFDIVYNNGKKAGTYTLDAGNWTYQTPAGGVPANSAGTSGTTGAAADKTGASKADANISRGKAAYDKKDYDTAIAEYGEALRIDPAHADTKAYLAYSYNSRGVAYYEKKDYDRAIADFDAALRFIPNAAIEKNRANAVAARDQPN